MTYTCTPQKHVLHGNRTGIPSPKKISAHQPTTFPSYLFNYAHCRKPSPVLRPDINGIHINTILQPPILIRNSDIIPSHLPLLHEPIQAECPVFQAVVAEPSLCPLSAKRILFVPELQCNLCLGFAQQKFKAWTLGG